MSLGYDTYESDRSFDKCGITGQVQRYSRESMNYPCYIVRSEDDNKVGMHQITVLKNMFDTTVKYDNTTEDDSIYIYFYQKGKVVRIGKLFPRQVKAFLRLFKGNYVDCFLDKDTELTGDYLYVLSE